MAVITGEDSQKASTSSKLHNQRFSFKLNTVLLSVVLLFLVKISHTFL